MTESTTQHIFEHLRKGLVPERGMDVYAVGIDAQRGEMGRQLDLVENGDGSIKFLRGGYGCGKTFTARLTLADARARGFATSFVVVSDSDLKFYRFEDVYRRVMSELATASCPRGAMNDVLDRWIGRVEQALIGAGANADAADFDAKVRKRLNDDLLALTAGEAPDEFVRVVQKIFDLKQSGDRVAAGALTSWLCGSDSVGIEFKKMAGVTRSVDSRMALAFLRGALAIVKAAGYKGLVIVIDEAETILRLKKDSRAKSLNGIRQIADAAGSYHGLLWTFTGTPEFFDTSRGIAGLPPLHDRIRFLTEGKFASVRQPQLELRPFDAERLRSVALRLRELYPARDKDRLVARIDNAFIDRLVADVTHGFGGDVGVVPRQFLRQFVNQMDLVDEHADYDPKKDYKFKLEALSAEENQVLSGGRQKALPVAADDDDDTGLDSVDVW